MEKKYIKSVSVITLFLFYSNINLSQSFSSRQTNPYSLTYIPVNNSTTALGDLDGDGDLDLMSGADNGNFYYYRNTGTPTSPSFGSRQTNPFSLTYIPVNNSTAALGDLDGDGDLDLMSGADNGNFYYYRNTGTPTSPSFGSRQTNPFSLTYIPVNNSTTAFVDLDGDGDLDLMSGADNGNFYFYRNTGTPTSPSFGSRQTNPYSLTYIPVNNSTTAFVDLDSDGDFDLMSGADNGNFYYYRNTGTSTSPSFGSRQTNPFSLTYIPVNNSTTAFGDLDGDGDSELISGADNGNFYYYRNSTPVGIFETSASEISVAVYPNPSTGVFVVESKDNDIKSIEILNIMGQIIYSSEEKRMDKYNIDLSLEPKGIYFIKITANEKNYTKNFVIE